MARKGLIGLGAGCVVLLALAMFLRGQGYLDYGTDEEKIRGVAAEFIDACRDRDFDDVWDLHSKAWREGMSNSRREHKQAGASIPEGLDDEALFYHLSEVSDLPEATREPTLFAVPWVWPADWLAELRVERVVVGPTDSFLDRKGDAEAILRFSGKSYGSFEPHDIRLVFVRDGGRWRIDSLRAQTFKAPEMTPTLPDIRTEEDDGGRAVLAFRIGFEPLESGLDDLASALATLPADATVRLEAVEDVDLEELSPWLEAIGKAGRPEVVLRSCLRSLPRMDYVIIVQAMSVMTVTDLTQHAENDLRIEIPESPPSPFLILPVGAGAPPPRSEPGVPGKMKFSTIPEGAESLKEFFDAAREHGNPSVPLLEPEAKTSVWKLVATWREVNSSSSPPALLALPGPGEIESRILCR